MKKSNILILILFFYALIAFIQIRFVSASSNSESGYVLKPGQEDEITFTYKFITDTDGWNSSALFYLVNHTNQKQRVTWSFEGTENAEILFNGDVIDIDANSSIWIATFTAHDISKPWDSGRLHYEWKPVN